MIHAFYPSYLLVGLKYNQQTKQKEVTIIPAISKSRNSVQVNQFLQVIVSAVPISELHVQGQRGSTVAVNTNYKKI